jgi:hypothetical protein
MKLVICELSNKCGFFDCPHYNRHVYYGMSCDDGKCNMFKSRCFGIKCRCNSVNSIEIKIDDNLFTDEL